MKNKCKYFIITVLLLCLGNSCNQERKEIRAIVVYDIGGYEYYLSEGRGTVYKSKMVREKGRIQNKGWIKEYPFHVSNKSINHIKQIYRDNDLKSLPDSYVLYSTNKKINTHQRVTTITFYFTHGKRKHISFWDDGYKNPLDRFPDKRVKPIFEEVFQYIKKIKDSTGERSELPI